MLDEAAVKVTDASAEAIPVSKNHQTLQFAAIDKTSRQSPVAHQRPAPGGWHQPVPTSVQTAYNRGWQPADLILACRLER
jgi:hypothetical protein